MSSQVDLWYNAILVLKCHVQAQAVDLESAHRQEIERKRALLFRIKERCNDDDMHTRGI